MAALLGALVAVGAAGWLWAVVFLAAVGATVLGVQANRGRKAAVESLKSANLELERARELDRRRVAVLEMVSSQAPLSMSLSAIAELAEHIQPGSGAAIWSVTEDALVHQVDAGLPPKLMTLARSEVFEIGSLAPTETFAAAAREADLKLASTILKNAAGDTLGQLMVFFPSSDTRRLGMRSAMAQLATLAIENTLLYQRLAFQAQHDVLTGLPNRLLFQDRLQQAIRVAHRNSRTLAVLWVDVDRFMHINDTFGHRAGDSLLCEIGHRCEKSIRDSDTAGRVGGDEFVVLLNEVDQAGAALVAQRIVEAARAPLTLSGQVIKASVSVGISMYPEHGTEPAMLMRNAGLAMTKAKRSGRDVQQVFLPQFGHSVIRRMELECELKNALDQGEFHLEYQPFTGRQNQIEGMEALLRWNSGKLGSVSPAEFIPVAEEAGLICEVGRWVAREACRQGSEWLRAGVEVPRIAINVSGIQFSDRGLAGMIREALEEFDYPASRLEIEVTESALVDNLESALEQIVSLRELGIRFAIDDFGTGYSSLNQLRTLPVDCIKVDRSFIKDLRAACRDTVTLVRGIINLAHNLQLEVVAEGVETQEQLSLLESMGCDMIQGFYLHRPLRASAVEDLLRAGSARPVVDEGELAPA